MKKNKGITLIALVITIIVLLILAGVTIASLSGDNGILKRTLESKEQTKKAAAEESIKIGLTEVFMDSNLGKGTFETLLKNKFGSGNVAKNVDGSFTITKDGYQVKVDSKGAIIESGNENGNQEIEPDDKSGANAPVIPNGLEFKYVTWNEEGTGDPILSTEEPANWYDYDNGKWANIKTTANGTEAYWVWIPRFEYKIPEVTDTNNPPVIDVKFISNAKNNPADGFKIHPAFTFGSSQLDGIWVAKFEACNIAEKVNIKPGVESGTRLNVSEMFTACRNMQSKGTLGNSATNIDGHMMKNMEWGAVAILSQSSYGIFNNKSTIKNDGKIWNNSNNGLLTGYAGTTADAANEATGNEYAYNTLNGHKASTTGTVYGVYDMAGGTYEYVMGIMLNEKTKLEPTGFTKDSSNNLLNIDSKYYDKYNNQTDLNTDYDVAIDGDATLETKGWNGDYASFPTSESPVYARGGFSNNGASAGIFYFGFTDGSASTSSSFRPVFVVP